MKAYGEVEVQHHVCVCVCVCVFLYIYIYIPNRWLKMISRLHATVEYVGKSAPNNQS
jgi:hypothetical protein